MTSPSSRRLSAAAGQVLDALRSGASVPLRLLTRALEQTPGRATIAALLGAGARVPDLMSAMVHQAARVPPALEDVVVADVRVPDRVRGRIYGAIEENWGRILEQLRDSRETSEICVRWAAGRSPTAPEMKVLKRQLADIAKSIPALAIFMMPFGVFVLAVLVKGLKLNLLPSAFQGERRGRRGGGA